MGRLHGEVIVKNPQLRNKKFENEIGLIIRYDWNLFRKSEYKLIFKNYETQLINSIGIHSFIKEELEKMK